MRRGGGVIASQTGGLQPAEVQPSEVFRVNRPVYARAAQFCSVRWGEFCYVKSGGVPLMSFAMSIGLAGRNL